MKVLSGPALVLDGDDCMTLSGPLVEAIRLGYRARGLEPPRALLEHAEAVSRVARRFASVRVNPQVRAPGEPATARVRSSQPLSSEPVWLSADEAARIAGISVHRMRKCLREQDPKGSRGARSAWRVEAGVFAAWLSRSRTESEE